ncbi:MAG: sialidase family protein [Candidatus Kapaibacterium sp.]
MRPASDTLLLGTRKGLMTFRKNDSGWDLASHAFQGQPIPYAYVDSRNGTLWAGIDHGHWGQKLHRSTDNGATWEEIPAPKYPEGEENGDGTPATVRYLWVMAGGGADKPNRLYIGTEPGGLFRSDDGGDTWNLVEGLWNHPSRKKYWMGGGRDYAGIHSIIVDPRDSSRVQVGISCAGVFETTDDGATWEPRNNGLRAEFLPDPSVPVGHDPHFVAASKSNPERLWQQNHGGIFRSDNGGADWEEVTEEGGPANFGFAIAVDEENPDTAWVVPATSDGERMAIQGSLCVCRTRDGGKSWEALRDGLPQARSYDVVFRHALDISGDRLAFGSTTGNAYVSEDQGNSWSCIGNNLPPVYSVRFA